MDKTPAEKWKDTITKYRKQCQKIIDASKYVRYAGVINEYGRTLTGIVRPGIKPMLKSEQVKNEFFIIATLMSLRKVHSGGVGNLEYIVLKHQKVSIVAYQKNKITYYASIDGKAKSLDKIILDIGKII